MLQEPDPDGVFRDIGILFQYADQLIGPVGEASLGHFGLKLKEGFNGGIEKVVIGEQQFNGWRPFAFFPTGDVDLRVSGQAHQVANI